MNWNKLINNANSRGIPIPMLRDPKTGKGSLTVTAWWISLNLCLLCTFMFLAVAFSKLTGIFVPHAESIGAIQNAASYALQLHVACASLYFGRKFQKDGQDFKLEDPIDTNPPK